MVRRTSITRRWKDVPRSRLRSAAVQDGRISCGSGAERSPLRGGGIAWLVKFSPPPAS